MSTRLRNKSTEHGSVPERSAEAQNWLWRRVIAENTEPFLSVTELREIYKARLQAMRCAA